MSRPLLPPIPPYTKQRLPTEQVTLPIVFPVLNAARWRSSYNEDWGTHRHTGCDLAAPKLSPVIAPFRGVLGFKPQTFWIVRDDGWGCLGTHLNDDTPGTRDNKGERDFMFAPNLWPGMPVHEGQLIGYVGDSGDADGPHLHFELHSPEGIRDPAPSLRTARRLTEPVVVPASNGEVRLPQGGQLLTVGCVRHFDSKLRRVTVVPLYQQRPREPMRAIARPARMTLSVGTRALSPLVQALSVAKLPPQTPLYLYHRGAMVEEVLVGATLPPQAELPGEPLRGLGATRLPHAPALSQCARAELAHFSRLTTPLWVRTGSMALGPLRMRGTRLKQAAILGFTGSAESLVAQELVQQALRYSGFTRFGGAVGKGRIVLILADG